MASSVALPTTVEPAAASTVVTVDPPRNTLVIGRNGVMLESSIDNR
jgi:hypothetical protein